MARTFTGSNANYLQRAAGLSAPQPITVSAWARPTSFAANAAVFSTDVNAANNRCQLYFRITTGIVTWLVVDSGGVTSDADSTAAASVNTWHHVVGTDTGTDRSVWLNGANKFTTTATRTLNATTQTTIGMRGYLATTVFTGQVAEVAVWAAALTDDEIAALARGVGPRFIRPASLWGYWPILGLDSPEPDWSGNGRQMTVNGTLAYATHSPTQLWMPPRPGPLAPVDPFYTQTKFRLYSNSGVGLGEAA